MHLEVLVEEPSAEAALAQLLPKIIGDRCSFKIIVHQGKRDLLKKLPNKLRGYQKWLPSDWRIIILVDEDRQDCRDLKRRLERSAADAGLATKSSPRSDGSFRVVNRLAIEELEAWFFGDVGALVRAYARVPPTLNAKAKYRDPDAIAGGTWEALERVLQKAGHYRGGMPKIEVARRVSALMNPAHNRSRSFRAFRNALQTLVSS